MNSENHHTHALSPLNDAIVFLVTVTVCTFLLTAASTFTQTTAPIADITPVLAMPNPPAPLVLAARPEPILPKVDVAAADAETTSWMPPASFVLAAEPEFVPPTVDLAAADAVFTSRIPPTPERTAPRESIPFHGIIVQVAGRYEVDPHLIRAIIFAESGYNPKAKSEKGAGGLMQLMPSTAKALGVQDIFDPEENIDGGVRYFKSLLDRFEGDVQLALAAYNAGSRYVRHYEGIPPVQSHPALHQKSAQVS